MMATLKRALDGLLGSGEASVTMPIMDGSMRPNNALDRARTLLVAAGIDNLAVNGGTLYFSQANAILSLTGVDAEPRAEWEFAVAVSAIALSKAGEMVVALDDGTVMRRSLADADDWSALDVGIAPAYVVAMAFSGNGDLYLCIGSSTHRASQWKHDLMNVGTSGSLWRIKAGERSGRKLAGGLAYPAGIGFLRDGRPVVSEAWKHRLVTIDDNGRAVACLSDLPGYPGRIAAADDGSLWVSVFAPRSQMIEFVLREHTFREQMVKTIDERFWMAPTLRAGKNFREPVQGGGIRHLGIQKPWGPTRSYGLIIRVADGARIVESLHSRSDGNRHGMTSVVAWNGRFVASSKGDGALIELPDEGGE